MSFDQRLRQDLRERADAIEPDLDRQLGAVEAGARHRRGVHPATLLLAAAVVVAALILRVPGPAEKGSGGAGASPVATASPDPGPSQAATSSAATYPEIAGTYHVALDPADTAVAKDGLGGSWTMRLSPDGAVFLSPPPDFAPGADSLSGIAFSLSGDRFRTNLFYNLACNSVGGYVWHLSAGQLAFTAVDDACSIRRTLLMTLPWQAGT
jgi:hypothetical protein